MHQRFVNTFHLQRIMHIQNEISKMWVRFARVCLGKKNVYTRLNSIYIYENTDRTTERVGLTLKNEFNSFQVTARMDGYYDACDISYVWNAHIRISTSMRVYLWIWWQANVRSSMSDTRLVTLRIYSLLSSIYSV